VVEVLFGTQALEPRSYLVTVTEHLERLGHEVHVFSAEPLPAPEELRVVGVERDLPLAPDVIYSQDAEAALLLAHLYPLTPQLFAAHGDRDDVWLPPQLAGVVARVVVFDERTRERVRAAALPQQVVRLRRPVDLDRIVSRGELPERPAKVRLQLDGVSDYRRGIVQRVLADARIELDEDADVVLGRGSAAVEALAEGRAVYVYGDDGGDGWVTPERYELLEADGFSGRAEPSATTFERLRDELEDYDPALGPAGRELAQAHDARAHAQQLVEAFDDLKPRRDPVDAPLRELARLVRVESATARRSALVAARLEAAETRAGELERELATARAGSAERQARLTELERDLSEAEARLEESGAQRGGRVRSLLGREGKPSSEG
jgi:hypothetical protein